jgi:hypothetical protein
MKKFMVTIMAMALIMTTAFTASAMSYYYNDGSSYAYGMEGQGIITGIAIEDVNLYDGFFSVGAMSVDTIALQGMQIKTGTFSGYSGWYGNDYNNSSINLEQNISIKTPNVSIEMNQTGYGHSYSR